MQWSIFIPQSDVIDTGSLGPCARFHFEMPGMVLKTAKAKACATKTSARFCRVLVLASSRELGKWVRSPPTPNRTQRSSQLWGKAAAKCLDFQGIFFYHKRSLLSGQLCPTLSVNCLADARNLGVVQSWMGGRPSHLYIHKTRRPNLGTTVSPSPSFGYWIFFST